MGLSGVLLFRVGGGLNLPRFVHRQLREAGHGAFQDAGGVLVVRHLPVRGVAQGRAEAPSHSNEPMNLRSWSPNASRWSAPRVKMASTWSPRGPAIR